MKKDNYFLMAIMTLILISCKDKVKESYKRVKKINDVELYKTFIKENYNSSYADSAMVLLQKKEFSLLTSIEDCNNYKRKYPKSIFIKKADSIIQQIEFTQAIKTNTKKSLEAFIKKYPQGKNTDSINKLLVILKKKNAQPTNAQLKRRVWATLKQLDKEFLKATGYHNGVINCGEIKVKVEAQTVYIRGNSIRYGNCASPSKFTGRVLDFSNKCRAWFKIAYKRVQKIKGVKTVFLTDEAVL